VDKLLAERGLDISHETGAGLGAEVRPDGCAGVGLGRAIDGIWTKW
jgi:hypothetical protein